MANDGEFSTKLADYTGVANRDLRRFLISKGVTKYSGEQKQGYCERIGIDIRWFNRVIYGEVEFIGLNIADRMCMGLNVDVSDVLLVIPSGYLWAARKMATDEYYAKRYTPTENELDQRSDELVLLRESALASFAMCTTCSEDTSDPTTFEWDGRLVVLCFDCRKDILELVA